jgi:hypothetical protein
MLPHIIPMFLPDLKDSDILSVFESMINAHLVNHSKFYGKNIATCIS